MAPARPRGVDDSRSETSSSITNLKDRSLLGPAGTSAIAKGKRVNSNLHSGISVSAKALPNGTAAAAPVDSDVNIPRIQWHALPTTILHTYRSAYRLPTASAHINPHADLILASSRTGLRSPSSVTARRKIRDAKHHARRKDAAAPDPSKHKDRERSSERLKGITATSNQTNQTLVASSTNTSIGVEGKATHSQLASAVRRHFNSQQVSEADVIAKFVYVVRHSGSVARAGGTGAIGISGSKIVGIGVAEADAGCEIGSSGREEDKRRDIDFRLRFRP